MIDIRFPKWCDNPLQFLIWEVDEVIPVAFCFVIFLPTRNLLLGLVIGILLTKLYKYMKDRMPSFWYVNYLWIYGLYNPKFKKTDTIKGYITKYQE